ncbi:hypothetical protein ABT119_31255 [Streptomyces sp. NPDC001910]|uniref:hypothetical protein n=1 Tax=Streptomyces sp. NPDC001910 TaxID=3154403 RepID=UPI00332D997B
MSGVNSGHLALIARWVRGEVVDNTVGIKVRGGPFNGRIRIVELNERHQPPQRQRARGSRGHPPIDVWHVYDLMPAPDSTAGWSYDYAGTEPFDVT